MSIFWFIWYFQSFKWLRIHSEMVFDSQLFISRRCWFLINNNKKKSNILGIRMADLQQFSHQSYHSTRFFFLTTSFLLLLNKQIGSYSIHHKKKLNMLLSLMFEFQWIEVHDPTFIVNWKDKFKRLEFLNWVWTHTHTQLVGSRHYHHGDYGSTHRFKAHSSITDINL